MNKNFMEINEKLRKEIIRLRLEKKMTKKRIYRKNRIFIFKDKKYRK